MGRCDLTAAILQYVGVGSLQNAGRPAAKPCRMLAQFIPSPTGLYADQSYLLVLDEVIENADRIRPTPNTSNDGRRELALGFQNLRPRLTPNHTMKVAHHRRIRMGSQHAAQQVVRGA